MACWVRRCSSVLSDHSSTTASLLVGVVMCVCAPAAVGAQAADTLPGREPPQDTSAVENHQSFDVLFGARVGIRGSPSPGASVRRRSTLRSEVKTDFLVGRLKLGIGRGDGASVFAFLENGEGTNTWRGGKGRQLAGHLRHRGNRAGSGVYRWAGHHLHRVRLRRTHRRGLRDLLDIWTRAPGPAFSEPSLTAPTLGRACA